MRNKEFKQLREQLESKREEAREFLSRIDSETRSLEVDIPQDSADRSVVSLSKESLFEQSSERRKVLRRIEVAIRRLDEGSFGSCTGCGKQISARRLQALPWTQYCLHCQERIEQGAFQEPVEKSDRVQALRRTG